MANHVYFNLSLEGLTDEQWDLMFKSQKSTRPHWKEGEPDIEYHELAEVHEQPFMSRVDREYDEEGWISDSYQWYCDNCGAKWVNIEEWENNGYITGYSAWSTPQQMVVNLLEYASNRWKLELTAKMTYEDEFRNFIGIDEFETYEEDGEWYCSFDEDYIDGNELTKMVEEKFDCDCRDDDFQWGDYYKDTDIVPQEWLDDVVYNYFETGELNGAV